MPDGRKKSTLPLLTILTPCYNEEGNVREVYNQVCSVMQTLPDYDYDHLFIDNASTDKTVVILRELAAADRRVKVIVNTRNFGHVRSPYYGLLQAHGNAVMTCVADLQDPPELIPEFVRKWQEGYKVVIGVKQGTRDSWLMSRTRKFYYWLVGRLSSDVELVHNFTGFGLYDREVIEHFRSTDEQYPYFRGLVSDFGYGVWALLQYLLGEHLHYLVIVLLSWPIAVANAYLGYRYVVFRSHGPILRELPRFSLVYVLTLLANLALLPVALNVLPFNIYVVQALLTALVVVSSYLSHRYYSFGGERRRDAPPTSLYDPPAVPED